MTNHLKQPPSIRLNVELCKEFYDLYLDLTVDSFILPSFESRYSGKLEGILGSVSQSFDNVYLFPTIGEAAAAYFVKIGTQHPFRDGNKRMSVYFTDVFLMLNNITVEIDYKKMYELAKIVVEKSEEKTNKEVLYTFVEQILNE